MKKLKLYQTIPLIIIAVLLCYLFKHYFVDLNKTVTVGNCELTFNCTPTEFINGDTDLPKEINSLRKNATIDETGHLELHCSRYQFYKLQNSDWFNDIKEFKDHPYLSHSEDYLHIVLNVTSEVKGFGLNKLLDLADDIDKIISKIRFRETLLGKSNFVTHPDILLEITDSETGEVIHSTVLDADFESYELPRLEFIFTHAPFLGQE